MGALVWPIKRERKHTNDGEDALGGASRDDSEANISIIPRLINPTVILLQVWARWDRWEGITSSQTCYR